MQGKGFCFTIIDLHTNTRFFIFDTQSSSSQIRGLPRLRQREAELKEGTASFLFPALYPVARQCSGGSTDVVLWFHHGYTQKKG